MAGVSFAVMGGLDPPIQHYSPMAASMRRSAYGVMAGHLGSFGHAGQMGSRFLSGIAAHFSDLIADKCEP